mgnify:CR=1 FL=1
MANKNITLLDLLEYENSDRFLISQTSGSGEWAAILARTLKPKKIVYIYVPKEDFDKIAD